MDEMSGGKELKKEHYLELRLLSEREEKLGLEMISVLKEIENTKLRMSNLDLAREALERKLKDLQDVRVATERQVAALKEERKGYHNKLREKYEIRAEKWGVNLETGTIHEDDDTQQPAEEIQ